MGLVVVSRDGVGPEHDLHPVPGFNESAKVVNVGARRVTHQETGGQVHNLSAELRDRLRGPIRSLCPFPSVRFLLLQAFFSPPFGRRPRPVGATLFPDDGESPLEQGPRRTRRTVPSSSPHRAGGECVSRTWGRCTIHQRPCRHHPVHDRRQRLLFHRGRSLFLGTDPVLVRCLFLGRSLCPPRWFIAFSLMQNSEFGHKGLPTLRDSMPAGRRRYRGAQPFVEQASRLQNDCKPRTAENCFCMRLSFQVL